MQGLFWAYFLKVDFFLFLLFIFVRVLLRETKNKLHVIEHVQLQKELMELKYSSKMSNLRLLPQLSAIHIFIPDAGRFDPLYLWHLVSL